MAKKSSRFPGGKNSVGKGALEASAGKTGQTIKTPKEKFKNLAIARFKKTNALKVEAEPQDLEDVLLAFKSQLFILANEIANKNLAVQKRQLDNLLGQMIGGVRRQLSTAKNKKEIVGPVTNFMIIGWFFKYLSIEIDNLTRENIMLILLSFLQKRQKKCG